MIKCAKHTEVAKCLDSVESLLLDIDDSLFEPKNNPVAYMVPQESLLTNSSNEPTNKNLKTTDKLNSNTIAFFFWLLQSFSVIDTFRW